MQKIIFFGQKNFLRRRFLWFFPRFTKNSSASVKNCTDENCPERDAVFPGLFITVKIEIIGYSNRSQGGAKSVTVLFYHEFFSLTPPCERS